MTISSITESVNPATEVIDTLSTRMIVAAIQAEDAKVAAAVAAVGDAIAQLVDVAAERMQRGGDHAGTWHTSNAIEFRSKLRHTSCMLE